MKVPYVEDKSASGGFGSPSEDDLSRMVRATVESWQPKRGPDWSNILVRIASAGPPAWAMYAAASAALVVILLAAFLIGSALQLGALAPQPIPAHLP